MDLFSDAPYGSIDFGVIDQFVEESFPYYRHFSNVNQAIGKSYSIGTSRDNFIKLDVFYTDVFIQAPLLDADVRMATTEEIIAMKVDVIQRIGRKKDFWDLHELLSEHDIQSMLALHKQRYPYTHDQDLIVENFTNFELADDDFDPICLRGKYWEFIKEDITEAVEQYNNTA